MDICDLQSQNLPASEIMKDAPNCSHTLPVTGLKEFQPSNSVTETKQIEDALKRQAAMLAVAKVDKLSFLIGAEWNADRKLALVTRRASGHFDVMGHEENARLWLYPEEILLLLELGRAELLYGGVTVSIQQGYVMLLGDEMGCQDIEYTVYKHLSHLGYRILRHKPCPTQYELDIRLEQCSAKPSRKCMIKERDVTRVDRMPVTLMEDDVEARTDSSPQEEIVLPVACRSQLETTVRSASRSSSRNESPTEEVGLEKFPNEFVVLDEWTAADGSDVSAVNESSSIVIDDDREIIGVTLEAKENADDGFLDKIVSKQKSQSDFLQMDEVVKTPSPKYLAEICPQIVIEPATVISRPDTDKVQSNADVNPPEIIPMEKKEIDRSEKDDVAESEDACMFSDLNAFLAEICPSPKQREDISPMSSRSEADFIGVSGIDASETVLNSLAEVNAYETEDEFSDEDDFRKLAPGFNVVVRQNMCPVLVDVPEPVETSYGKRRAETAEEVGGSKRLRSDQEGIDNEGRTVHDGEKSHPDLTVAGTSKEPLVNGVSAESESDTESGSTVSLGQEPAECRDHSGSSSEDDDFLNIESNREELESLGGINEYDSDLEIIEIGDVEVLSVTVSNKRKQTDDEVRNVKRRPVIEVVNLSDEETESSDNETEDLNQAETDVMSVDSGSSAINVTEPRRKKYWDPALLEDQDRTTILRSIVNVANKTQIDLSADCRYVPANCNPIDKRVKVFRLNAIGIGGKPSVDYVPAHKVIEARGRIVELPPSVPSLFDVQVAPPPLLGHPSQLTSPWVQVGPHNFLPNYQLTVHNPPPPSPWQQPSSAFIAPNNMGYAIPGSFAPPRHCAPLLHVVYTPRMQNRTIRGVTKVARPQSFDRQVRGGPAAQGWFQQNNVFNEPNAIRVELPPPVKPEPWVPGVMRKMKDEVPVTSISLPLVKEEASSAAFNRVPNNVADEEVAVGNYTLKKVLDSCPQAKENKRSMLRFEWTKMLRKKKFEKTTRKAFKFFEYAFPWLKGMTANVSKIVASWNLTANHGSLTQVKDETLGTNSVVAENILKQVAHMISICPPLVKLTPLQIVNLRSGLQMKARGVALLKPQLKVLRYVGKEISAYARSVLKRNPLPLDLVNELITCVKVVCYSYSKITDSLESWRDECLLNLNVQAASDANAATEVSVIDNDTDELSYFERAGEAGASDDNFGIVDLKTLAAKIEEWVRFQPPVAIEWSRTKKQLENGDPLSVGDYNTLNYAQSNDRRLYFVLPLMVNRAYMGNNLIRPFVHGSNAPDAQWRNQLPSLVAMCPWLNTFSNAKLRFLGKAVRCKSLVSRPPSQSELRLLECVCEMITRVVKSILGTDQQQSNEVDILIDWANYFSVSEKKIEFSELLKESINEREFILQNSQRNIISSNVEIPENNEQSAEESSGETEESAEETNLKSPSESSPEVDSGKDTVSTSSSHDNNLPVSTKQLNAQVVEIMAWMTLSEEQAEVWKRAKERMRNGEAFIAEDVDLFRFAATQDERFCEIEHLIEVGAATTDAVQKEAALQEMEGEVESRDSSCQQSSSEEEVVEPLIKPSDCTDYASVISKLGIIGSATAELAADGTSFKISYDLYLPMMANNTPFRKSNPGKPDYRIIVLRPEDRLPRASDFLILGKRYPDRVPLLFAIVRGGTVSFLRLDAVQLPADLTEYGHGNES